VVIDVLASAGLPPKRTDSIGTSEDELPDA
jgi:hypothetical protein